MAAAVLILLAAGILYRQSGKVKVDDTTVTRRQVEDWYQENGVLHTGETYSLISQVSGEILEICKQENDPVEAGEVLLRIDPRDYEYEKQIAEAQLAALQGEYDAARAGELMTQSPGEYLAAAKSSWESAESSLQAAQTLWTADQSLYNAGEISRLQYESDRSFYEAAFAACAEAKARYEESQARLTRLQAELEAENRAGTDAAQTSVDSLFYEGELTALSGQIEAARAGIDRLSRQIEGCTVRAPKAGIVMKWIAGNCPPFPPAVS